MTATRALRFASLLSAATAWALLSAAGATPAPAQDALVFDSSLDHAVGATLVQMVSDGGPGAPTGLQTSSAASFVPTALLGGWELLALDVTGGAPQGNWRGAVSAAIADGACVLLATRDAADLVALGPSFQAVSGMGPANAPAALYTPFLFGGFLFTFSNTVPDPLDSIEDNFDPAILQLTTLPGGGQRAVFQHSTGPTAVVQGNSGRTFFNGFAPDDYGPADADTDSESDIRELIENEVLMMAAAGCSSSQVAVVNVPTLGSWGLLAFAAALAGIALATLRPRG